MSPDAAPEMPVPVAPPATSGESPTNAPPAPNSQIDIAAEGSIHTGEPPAAEAPIVKEITPASQEKRREETGMEFHTGMMRKVNEAVKKNAEGKTLSAEDRTFLQYGNMYREEHDLTDRDYSADPRLHGGISFGEPPVSISNIDGNEWIPDSQDGDPIVLITGRVIKTNDTGEKQAYYLCTLGSGQTNQEVPAHIVTRALVQSRKGTYLSAFAENSASRLVAENHIQSLEDPQTQPPSNEIIAKAALEMGMPSTNVARELITNSDVSTELKNELNDLLDGKNVATAQDMGTILHKLNNIEDTLAAKRAQLADAEQTVTHLQRVIENLPPGHPSRIQLETKIAEIQVTIKSLSGDQKTNKKGEIAELEALAQDMPVSEEAMQALVQNAYDTGTATDLIAAMKEKDHKKIMQTLIGKIDDNDPEKAKKMAWIESALKYGGIGIAAVILIMVMRSSGEQR